MLNLNTWDFISHLHSYLIMWSTLLYIIKYLQSTTVYKSDILIPISKKNDNRAWARQLTSVLELNINLPWAELSSSYRIRCKPTVFNIISKNLNWYINIFPFIWQIFILIYCREGIKNCREKNYTQEYSIYVIDRMSNCNCLQEKRKETSNYRKVK